MPNGLSNEASPGILGSQYTKGSTSHSKSTLNVAKDLHVSSHGLELVPAQSRSQCVVLDFSHSSHIVLVTLLLFLGQNILHSVFKKGRFI